MAKVFIVLAGITAIVVQGAVLKNEDAVLRRLARSPGHCGECEEKGGPPPPPLPPPPPPPPGIPPFPVFHTQQWSGVARANDGSDQGLFSGAAAGIEGGEQTGAFSLASTAVGSSIPDGTNGGLGASQQSSSNIDGKNSDRFGQSSGGASFGGFGGAKFSGSKSSFKESQFSYQAGDNFESGHHHHHHHGLNENGSGYGFGSGSAQSSSHASSSSSAGYDSGRNFPDAGFNFQRDQANSGSGAGAGYFENQQQSQSQNSFTHGGRDGSGFGSSGHYQNAGSGYRRENSQYGQLTQGPGYNTQGRTNEFSDGQQGLQQVSHSEFENGASNYQSASDASSSSSGQSSSAGYGSGQGNGQLQSGLGDALKLASQGLQQAGQQQSGCSTCGKSSYALSNAKSKSGSAIALSVAG